MRVKSVEYKKSEPGEQKTQKTRTNVTLTRVVLDDEEWVIPSNYRLDKTIGRGSYGTVVSATDRTNGQVVAIKKNRKIFALDEEQEVIPNVFWNRSSISQLRVLREVEILRHLNGHPNIITLKDLVVPPSFKNFKDVYIVTDIMDADLRDALESLVLSESHIRYFMYQLLQAVAYIHDAGITHRDIKPEVSSFVLHVNCSPQNILINQDCSLKLCDFGLARGCDFEVDVASEEIGARFSTNYVQTRFYRAPELLMDSDCVGKAVDIWSVGCVMAEMLNGGNILFKGATAIAQLTQIIEMMGCSDIYSLHGSQEAIEYVETMDHIEPNPNWHIDEFAKHNTNLAALDLLKKLLEFDPAKRITAKEALKHEFFGIVDHISYGPITKFTFKSEEKLLSIDTRNLEAYGNLIKREVFNIIMQHNGLQISEKNIAKVQDSTATQKKNLINRFKCYVAQLWR